MARQKSLTVLLLTLLALLMPIPASAHDALVGSDPADGAVLEEAPKSVTLTFSGEPIDVAPQMILRQGNETIAQLEPVLSGFDVNADLPAMDVGDYAIAYSIVSSDGHRIEGAIDITIAAGQSSEPEQSTDPGESSEPAGSLEPTTEDSSATASAEPSAEVLELSGESGDNSAVTWIRLGGIIVVVLGLSVIISRKLRSR